MTNMAAMPIFGKQKHLKTFSGTNGPIALNLVCSIGVSGPIVGYLNGDWLDLDPIYG